MTRNLKRQKQRELEDLASLLEPGPGRVPPQDLDAEAAVLSMALLDPVELETHCIGRLEPKHFYSDANRRIYDAILALHADGSVPNVVAVAGYLRDRERLQQVGGTPYLAQIADATPANARIAEQIRTLIDHWRRRQMIAICQRTAAYGYGRVEEGGEFRETQPLLEESSAELTELAFAVHTRQGLQRLDVATTHGEIVDLSSSPDSLALGFSSGWIRLDAKIQALRAGQLHIFGARPGMGKTQYALNLTLNIAQREPQVDDSDYPTRIVVIWFSLEMPMNDLCTRLLAILSGIPMERLFAGKVRPAEYDALATAAQKLSRLEIYVDDRQGLSPRQMQAEITRLQRQVERDNAQLPEDPRVARSKGLYRKRLGLWIMDYLQLASPSIRTGSREQDVASITRESKGLCKLFGIPGAALAQLNRNVEARPKGDRRPQIADLRESGAIEQDADVIHLLYRDEYYFKDSKEAGQLEVNIAKQRNGPTGRVRLAMNAAVGVIRDLERGSDEVDEYDQFDAADNYPDHGGEDW